MKSIHICVRSTLDWCDPAAVEAALIPQFRPKVEAWNATFTMPYHVFRGRLRKIARLNLGRIAGAVCSTVEAVPPGDLIVPVDDDDWFAPDLADRLRRESDPGARGFVLTRVVIEPSRRIRDRLRRVARLLGRRDRVVCKTNNYAVVNDVGIAHLALNHVQASRYFDAHPSDFKRVPGVLAIQNRTLASQTSLAWGRPSIGRDALVRLFRCYDGLYASWPKRADLAWAKPYVDMMAELMNEIRPR
jgi:hypothetical protein